MEFTAIEWATHTFNPWEGCTKISPGCLNCYAAARNERFGRGVAKNWGKGAPRRRTSRQNWNKVSRWNKARQLEERDALACGRDPGPRPRVFCASIADWLDEEIPVEWLADLLEWVRIHEHLNWLLLSKRPHLWEARLQAVIEWSRKQKTRGPLYSWCMAWRWKREAPKNVWVGTTVEDQFRADTRIPHLLGIPAVIRFLSCEPLLGTVSLGLDLELAAYAPGNPTPLRKVRGSAIHLVVAGGESGKNARPMHPGWARSLRDECLRSGVAFLFKQWGEWTLSRSEIEHQSRRSLFLEHDGTDSTDWPVDHRTPTTAHMILVGKKKAGRELDGKIHHEFPRPGVTYPKS